MSCGCHWTVFLLGLWCVRAAQLKHHLWQVRATAYSWENCPLSLQTGLIIDPLKGWNSSNIWEQP